MNRRIIFLLLTILLFVSCSKATAPAPQPPTVSVITVKEQSANIYQTFIGQTYGAKDIEIPARVEGFLTGMHFSEGTTVKKGKLLYTIDAQPFTANVAEKMSKLVEAQTEFSKAESDLNRTRPLAESNAVSQSDLDAAVAQFEASKAMVTAAEATLKSAKIELSYTRITAPLTGLIGKTQAKVGSFVGRSANNSTLNTISDITTIVVQFFLTENEYLAFSKVMLDTKTDKPVKIKKEKNNLELILADGSLHPEKGSIDFVDRNINPMTGTILIEASFPNPNKRLRPGLYAKVRALVEVKKDAILVPQRAVSELQELKQIFVVSKENKVELREIKIAHSIGDKWLVTDGIKDGERVIVEGGQLVKDGVTVTTVDYKEEKK
ncbi:efflux RND transporter periplasmic adaptor subunit [bacterium]|nr:efflux RND transporter periplasmic adaptor subunit [bacterium]